MAKFEILAKIPAIKPMKETNNFNISQDSNVGDLMEELIVIENPHNSKLSQNPIEILTTHDGKMPPLFNQNHTMEFTGLPFENLVHPNIPIKMKNVVHKIRQLPKFVVAPDGYIPNSKIREHYPKYLPSKIIRKSEKMVFNEDDDLLIANILETHLKQGVIREACERKFQRNMIATKKKHFDTIESEALAAQSDVIDQFDHELEKLQNDDQKSKIKMKFNAEKHKKKKAKMISNMKLLLQERRKSLTHSEGSSDIEHGRLSSIRRSVRTQSISFGIDILDKIEKNLEYFDKHGQLTNEKIQERILRDRKLRMPHKEFLKWFKTLRESYDTLDQLYEDLKLAINNDEIAISKLEEHFSLRTKRLEFLNTLTDSRHLYDYLLFFYNNKRSELIGDLNAVNLHQQTMAMDNLQPLVCEPYRIHDYLNDFIKTKNEAVNILTKKLNDSQFCKMLVETSLQEGPMESVVFEYFASSQVDADNFFLSILNCDIDGVKKVMKNIKLIEEANKRLLEETLSQEFTKSEILSEMKTRMLSLESEVGTTKLVRDIQSLLPPLPVSDENSWKVFMSEYLSQMISRVIPKSDQDKEFETKFTEDKSIREYLADLNFVHNQVLSLIKNYLKNDLKSSQKLLEGIIEEDDLAIKALIELIGERETIQITKTLKLQQAKLMEKFLELRGDDKEMHEAKIVLKGSRYYLPGHLNIMMDKWIGEDLSKDKTTDEPQKIVVIEKPQSIVSKSIPDHSVALSIFQHDSETAETTSNDTYVSFFTKEPKQRTSQRFSILDLHLSKTDTVKDGRYFDESQESDDENELRQIKASPTDIKRVKPTGKEFNILDNVDIIQDELHILLDKLNPERVDVTKEKMTVEKFNVNREKELEEQFCDGVCHINWYTKDPAFSYEDLAVNIADLVTKTADEVEVKEMSKALIDIVKTQHLKSKVTKEISHILVGEVRHLIGELSRIDKAEKMLLNPDKTDTSLSISDSMYPPIKSKASVSTFPLTSFLSSLATGEISASAKAPSEFDLMVSQSILKQKKIDELLEILSRIDPTSASKMHEELHEKKLATTLFLPERQAQIEASKKLGYHSHKPIEIIGNKPEIIVRNKAEQIDRVTVRGRKSIFDANKPYELGLQINQMFWNEKEETMGMKLTEIGKEAIFTAEPDENAVVDRLYKPHQKRYDLKIDKFVSDKDHIQLAIPINTEEEERSRSIENLANTQTPLLMGPSDVVRIEPEKVDEHFAEIQAPDEVLEVCPSTDIAFKTAKAKPITIKDKSQLRRPSDPYTDFHLMYGHNNYFLPFINPSFHNKVKQGEDYLPSYYDKTKHKQTEVVYKNIEELVKGYGGQKKKKNNFFIKGKFERRPSDLSLLDWTRIGNKGMAANMSISTKDEPSRKKIQGAGSINFKNYRRFGLSDYKIDKRMKMVEMMSLANSASIKQNIKMKMMEDQSDSSYDSFRNNN